MDCVIIFARFEEFYVDTTTHEDSVYIIMFPSFYPCCARDVRVSLPTEMLPEPYPGGRSRIPDVRNPYTYIKLRRCVVF